MVAIWLVRAFYLTVKDTGVSITFDYNYLQILAKPTWQIFLGFYLIALFVAINVLNAIWFSGILKHVKRSLKSKNANKNGDF